MSSRALAWSLPVLAIALAWSLIEEPVEAWPFVTVCALSLPLALLRRARWSIALAVVGVAIVACVMTVAWPLGALDALADGLRRAAEVGAPYDPVAERALHELVVVVAGAFAAAVAVAIAADRPLLAGTIAVLAVGYPATLHERHPLALGCLAAAAALWPAVVLRARTPHRLVVGLTFLCAAVVTSVALGGAGISPERASLDWQGWSPLGANRSADTVRSVWDSSYAGIDFPNKATVVLRIRAPHRLLYWRASTLDVFTDDHWVESLLPVAIGPSTRTLAPDPLLPRPPASQIVRQDVEVDAYADDRLPLLAQPIGISTRAVSRIFELSGGVLFSSDGVGRGDRYTVWSRLVRPSPRALADAGTAYPAGIGRYLELGRARFPVFGAPGRNQLIRSAFVPELHPELSAYAPLWRKARSLTRKSQSPYEATIALESWLRATGGFGYTESPPRTPAGVPPLVDFAIRTKLGYCQHFAGTMALMLRTLGIPARVAVGFTSGRWKDDEWVVTDHEAHAWVEAWFPGYGWLPFDPTPGRGTLSADYTLASDSADAVRALGTGKFLQPEAVPSTTTKPPVHAQSAASSSPRVDLWLPLALAAIIFIASIVPIAKWLRRRRRLRETDPRSLAYGARAELADLLVDHGVEVARTASSRELRGGLRRLGVDGGALENAMSRARYARDDDARRAAPEVVQRFEAVRRAVRIRRGRFATLRATFAIRSLRRA